MNRVLAQFFIEPVQNGFKTEQEGYEVYDDREHIRILVAGSKDEIVRLVTDEDKRTYEREYKAFQAGQTDPVTGTPLKEMPGISASLVRELAQFNVKTVEALAELPEGSRAFAIMGIREWSNKAKAYIANATGDAAVVTQLVAEKDAMAKQLADMKAQILALQAGKPAQPEGDTDGDGKLSPLERGMQAARDGKPRNVPPAYRGKDAGDEWELGYDDVKNGKSA